MRTLLAPKWLLLVNTGPLLLLAALCYGEFSVIHTQLPPESIALWQQFGLGLAALGGATLLYAGRRLAKGQELSSAYAVGALLAYSLFLGLYTTHSNEVLPRSVPRWMVPTDILVYVWTFVMPTLAHALLMLVVRTTPPGRPHSVAMSWVAAIAVPLGIMLLLNAVQFLLRLLSSEASGLRRSNWLDVPLELLVLAVGPVVFLFFLVRGIYILVERREQPEIGLLLRVVLTLVLPLLGLAVNAGLFFDGVGRQSNAGIFGNFSSPWFYGLAALNGLLLCLPAADLAPRWRLALLVGRSVLLGYTGYFCLVFLPFLPLSMLAIILIGTGFLMLAPLLLLVVHLAALNDDLAALQPYYSPLVRRVALVGGAAVLPLSLTASYYHDRHVLHQALEYAYSPDYAKHYDLDTAALARTLAVIEQHKDNNWDLFMGSQQPYLSAYYNWLVLDNLTLPESKVSDLEKLFLGTNQLARGQGRWGWSQAAPAPALLASSFVNRDPNQPQLQQLSARSTYDAREQAWVSWVDMEIANANPNRQLAEYSTAIALPVGCWVGDYYLDINQRREPGILAERKAATWVYTQILNEQAGRDPGLLSYTGPQQLALRVYPVSGAAVRRTGIQLLHKEPLTLTIDGRSVQLGTPAAAPVAAPLATPSGGVVYLSAQAKRQLPLVQRRPYYHFLLDVSAGQEGQKAGYAQRVKDLLREQPLADSARFSLVNTYTTPVASGSDWQQALAAFPNAGGCYLTGAVRRVLTAAQQHPAATYPRLVVVTDNLDAAVLPTDFADLRAAYPDSDLFYVLLPTGRLEAHSLRQAAARPLDATTEPLPAPTPVRAWPSVIHAQAYLPATEEASIVLPHPAARLAVPAGAPTRWLTGLLLHGFDQWQSLHPEATEGTHVPFVQASFRARILTPLTAYLVLENEAQKAALRRKQDEVLAANVNLDAQESEPARPPGDATAVPLNEGEWLLLLVGLAFGVRQLRQRYRVSAGGW